MRSTLEPAVVIAVDDEYGTLTVEDLSGAIIPGVIPVSPYYNPVENHGMKIHPDPGSHCLLHFGDDHSVYCLGYVMPADNNRKRNTAPTEGDSSTQEMLGRYGNALRIEGSGISRLLSNAIAQVMTIPVLNLVRIVAERFNIQTALGELQVNTSKDNLVSIVVHAAKEATNTVLETTVETTRVLTKILNGVTITIDGSSLTVTIGGTLPVVIDNKGVTVNNGVFPTMYIVDPQAWQIALTTLSTNLTAAKANPSLYLANLSIFIENMGSLFQLIANHKNLKST
jgi:hypothetical protein